MCVIHHGVFRCSEKLHAESSQIYAAPFCRDRIFFCIRAVNPMLAFVGVAVTAIADVRHSMFPEEGNSTRGETEKIHVSWFRSYFLFTKSEFPINHNCPFHPRISRIARIRIQGIAFAIKLGPAVTLFYLLLFLLSSHRRHRGTHFVRSGQKTVSFDLIEAAFGLADRFFHSLGSLARSYNSSLPSL